MTALRSPDTSRSALPSMRQNRKSCGPLSNVVGLLLGNPVGRGACRTNGRAGGSSSVVSMGSAEVSNSSLEILLRSSDASAPNCEQILCSEAAKLALS